MKEIPLTRGKVAIVDDEDFEELSKYKWHYTKVGYAAGRCESNNLVYMHRVIMLTPKGLYTDHVNHNKLDNRKENLRICSNKENCRSSILNKNNTSGYKGVSFNKHAGLWRAYIMVDYKEVHLGLYKNPIDAAIEYNKKAIEYFGNYALLNAEV